MSETTLEYARGSQSAEALQRTVDAILQEEEIEGLDGVRIAEAQGADPLTVIIVVALLRKADKMTDHAAKQVWDEIIWPKIKRRLADDALGEREPEHE